MAQKAIREFWGKQLIFTYLPEFISESSSSVNLFKKNPYQGITLTTKDILSAKTIELPQHSDGYITKPDELFGKRGKNNLVFMGKSAQEVLDWLKGKAGKTVTIEQNHKNITGVINHFLVEPFIKHNSEYYLSIRTGRDHDKILFSNDGGVDIEENWEQVVEIKIPFKLENTPIKKYLSPIITKTTSDQDASQILEFISALYQVFKKLSFTYLEINPFVIENRQIHILDLVARLDDTALYENRPLWEKAGKVEFPPSFGNHFTQSELNIMALDSKSGASLKFKLLNPDGKIWLLTSGGGGSVIFADTVGDLGFHTEIANYTDYSGNPNTEETREFCENIFTEMLESKAKEKILIIGGGIANFTDIAKTFTGIIKAINKFSSQFKSQNIKIYVRRGGPNYRAGLQAINKLGSNLGIEIHTFGPEMYMTEVVKLALTNTK